MRAFGQINDAELGKVCRQTGLGVGDGCLHGGAQAAFNRAMRRIVAHLEVLNWSGIGQAEAS